MAKISSFNRPEGNPIPAQEETVIQEETKNEIPKATFTVNPPRFQPKPQLTAQEEYDEALKLIEEGKANRQPFVIIHHDLQDLAWQKLSQAGYKLQRRFLEKTGVQSGYVCEKDQNKVEFEISLTDFNRTDI